jgi:hypothetical protein
MAKNPPSAESPQGYERKPAVVLLCTAVYLINPLGNFLYQWRLSEQGINDFVLGLFSLAFDKNDPMVIANLLLWALAPLVAVGIFRVRVWGWFLYLVHAVAASLLSFFGPGFSSLTLTTASFINLPFFAIAGYYLFSEIQAPYFNPRLRWWERHARYRNSIHIIIEGREYKLFDISAKGLFVVDMDAPKRKIGDKLVAHISFGSEIASLKIEVIRVHLGGGDYPAGFGARFVSMDSGAHRAISDYIRVLRRASKNDTPVKAA